MCTAAAVCNELQKHKKPAYIEVCCNLAGLRHPSFTDPPIPISSSYKRTNSDSLAAAVNATAAVSGSVTAERPVSSASFLPGLMLVLVALQDGVLFIAQNHTAAVQLDGNVLLEMLQAW